MTPPYPLANEPGVHVFLLAGLDDVTTCELATVSLHRAADKWECLHRYEGRLEVQVWHGDRVRVARYDWVGGRRAWVVRQ